MTDSEGPTPTPTPSTPLHSTPLHVVPLHSTPLHSTPLRTVCSPPSTHFAVLNHSITHFITQSLNHSLTTTPLRSLHSLLRLLCCAVLCCHSLSLSLTVTHHPHPLHPLAALSVTRHPLTEANIYRTTMWDFDRLLIGWLGSSS